jgi:MFS transporter, PPP family, 3-phenylpropionic acid transporter
MAHLPRRRLAGFYFFYFAYLGAFAPFFSIYLKAVGLSPVEIGVVMALPAVARMTAPHLWGWLADASGGLMRIVRATTLAGLVCWLGMFAGTSFVWICAVAFALSFFLSAAIPLVDSTTLLRLGERTGDYGRIRLWGSIGYMVAVVTVGYLLDLFQVSALLWIVLVLIGGTLALGLSIPETDPPPQTEAGPITHILKRPAVVALIAGCALMVAAHGPYYSFYSIHLVSHGYSKALTGWLWALGVLCEIGIFFWLPRLYGAFTLRQILIASFALAVVRFLVIGWGAGSLVLLLCAQTLHAATFGSFHAAAIGIVHRLFRGRHQARGQAIYGSLTYGVGGTLGSVASGYGWEQLGASQTFGLAAAAAGLGMLIILWKLELEEREP